MAKSRGWRDELHRRCASAIDGDAERRDERIGEPRERAPAPRAARRAWRRRLVAVLLEVIDERCLELDRASGRAPRPSVPDLRARRASGRRTAARACDARATAGTADRATPAASATSCVTTIAEMPSALTCSRISRASTRTRCGSSPTDGSSRNSSLRRLASTRATATRCAWPPDSAVTGVPGSASSRSRPTRSSHVARLVSSLSGVAQRELEVAAHVEMIEQRAALRHEAELRRDRDRAARRRRRSLRRRARRARTARARTSICRRPIRRAARRLRRRRSRDRCRRSARARRAARRAVRVPQAPRLHPPAKVAPDTPTSGRLQSQNTEPRGEAVVRILDRNACRAAPMSVLRQGAEGSSMSARVPLTFRIFRGTSSSARRRSPSASSRSARSLGAPAPRATTRSAACTRSSRSPATPSR